MATTDGATITVAVEKAIHQGLKRAIQAISEEHGIQIRRLDIEWLDISMVGDRLSGRYAVQTISVESFSR